MLRVEECRPFTLTNALLPMLDFVKDLSFFFQGEGGLVENNNTNKKKQDSHKFFPIEMVKNHHWVNQYRILWVVPSTLNVIHLARERVFIMIVKHMIFRDGIIDDAGISLPHIIVSGAMRCILKLIKM